MGRPALPTDGARQVASLADKGYVVADRMGVSKQLLSQWAKGTARPSIDMAYRLERLFGIPMQAWARLASKAALDQRRLREVTTEATIDEPATKTAPSAA